MKKSYVVSAIIAMIFFVVIYAILNINFLVSFVIAFGVYFASFIIFKNFRTNEAGEIVMPKKKILSAEEEKMINFKKITADLYTFAINSKDERISKLLKEISALSEKLEEIETNNLLIKSQNEIFLEYFLNVAYKTAKMYMNEIKYATKVEGEILDYTIKIETEVRGAFEKYFELREKNILMDVNAEIKRVKKILKII